MKALEVNVETPNIKNEVLLQMNEFDCKIQKLED